MITKKGPKKPKTKKAKKTSEKIKTKKSKTVQKKKKDKDISDAEMGLVVIEEDLEVDKKGELEERRAYLEEARSQEASD